MGNKDSKSFLSEAIRENQADNVRYVIKVFLDYNK